MTVDGTGWKVESSKSSAVGDVFLLHRIHRFFNTDFALRFRGFHGSGAWLNVSDALRLYGWENGKGRYINVV